MTTIATDGKSMAGDGLVVSGSVIFATAFPKVRRLKDGRIVGIAGSAFHYEPFIGWLENGGDKPKIDSDNFDALVLTVDGKVFNYDAECRCIEEELPTACGSGRGSALTALDAGLTPEEAVNLATKRDTQTGGAITVLYLEPRLEAAA